MSALSEQPEIKIDDLVVRPWRSDDAEAVYQACQDPDHPAVDHGAPPL